MYKNTLGDSIGFGESLEEEFKEFIMKIDPIKYFEEDEIRTIVNTGRIDSDIFNLMITDNIAHYFKYYLPKYISCFGNSSLSHGNLYIGANDFGEITGIPFFGTLTNTFMESFLEVLESYISDKDILKEIKLEVIKLEYDELYLDDAIDPIIKDFYEKKKKFEEEYNKNILERRIWKEKMDYFTARIYDFANKKDLRKVVIDFVKTSPDYTEEYHHIIDLLESSAEIPVGDGAEIALRKLDKHDIIYWLTSCKDTYIDKIKSERPYKIPYMYYSNSIYVNQFSLLSNLRYRFINNNVGLHYYLVKISFPTKYDSKIYFRNENDEKWIIRTRAIVNNVPGCF